MTTKSTLSLTLLASLAACSLIKVNGKPLGGGSSAPSTSSSSSSNSEPEATTTDAPRPGSHAESEAIRQREYEAQEKKAAADKAGQPALCGDYAISNARDINLENFANLDDPKHDWTLDANNFAEAMCSTRGAHLELRPKVMALRTKWMKQHGLDENDFLVVLVERMGRGWPQQDFKDVPGPISQVRWRSHLEMDQLGAKTSMLARVSFIERCLQDAPSEGVLKQILCASEPLDASKGMAEIEATPDVNIQTRYHLRQLVRNTVAAQTALRGQLTKEAKDDPGIAQLVAIADAQRKDWATPSATRARLLGLIETMEAATETKKRSAFAGCDATTRAAWADAVKAAELPAVAEKQVLTTMMNAVFKTPEAYLGYRALTLCADGMDASFASRFDIIGSSYLRRGPRTSTIAAWMAASGEIKFDSKELDMSHLLRDVGARSGSAVEHVSIGTIDKVVANGATVHVSFKPDVFEYNDCINWRSTGRISRIETNGAISYVQLCTETGRVKYDRKPEDVSLSAFVGSGLKPGMMFMVTEEGFPIVATASTKSTKAVWLFGVALAK